MKNIVNGKQSTANSQSGTYRAPIACKLLPVGYSRGFTLIETLVAITVLTLAILAPFAAIQQVIRASSVSKQELIASSLAQEAMEYVRLVRTSNYLVADTPEEYHPMAGFDGINSSNIVGLHNCLAPRQCTVDATVAGEYAINYAEPVPPLYLSANKSYTQDYATSGNVATIFYRSFDITQHSGYQTVTVTVSWTDHGDNTMVLTENFYDWL